MTDMNSAEQRYVHNPLFHALVTALYQQMAIGNFTPSECREAVMLACAKYENQHPPPFSLLKKPREDGE